MVHFFVANGKAHVLLTVLFFKGEFGDGGEMGSDFLDEGVEGDVGVVVGFGEFGEAVFDLFFEEVFEEMAVGQLTRELFYTCHLSMI